MCGHVARLTSFQQANLFLRLRVFACVCACLHACVRVRVCTNVRVCVSVHMRVSVCVDTPAGSEQGEHATARTADNHAQSQLAAELTV